MASRAKARTELESEPPLCVDLDGTLIKTDVLVESLFVLLRLGLWHIVLFPAWLTRGKAHFKDQVARRVDLDPEGLPYRQKLLDYLREQRESGRRLVLATASNEKPARLIADHLGLFDAVLASTDQTNLSGKEKGARLLNEFGERGFDYAGNARVDLEIWKHARSAILVNPDAHLRAQAERSSSIERIFDDEPNKTNGLLRAMRPHQWLKNLLLFGHLAAAHQVGQPELLLATLLAFVSFCLCTSSMYLLNDLLDLPSDRKHPSKRHRPFASGSLSVVQGVIMVPVLLVAAIALALMLPATFVGVLLLYCGITIAYSIRLKQVEVLDVLILAGLYALRVLAGAAAVAEIPSFWLLALCMFLFLSLAMVKRYSELLEMRKLGEEGGWGRSYQLADLDTLATLGATSGYMAVLVLALYINSDKVTQIYSYPLAIWLICPLLLYWISRVWIETRRGKMHSDPVIFAIRDRASRWVALISMLILLLAS